MVNEKGVTSITLSANHRAKLQRLADTLGISRNATIGLLIENAQIGEVTRSEPVATVPNVQQYNGVDGKAQRG